MFDRLNIFKRKQPVEMARRPASAAKRTKPLMLQLEQRVMFDGAVAATVALTETGASHGDTATHSDTTADKSTSTDVLVPAATASASSPRSDVSACSGRSVLFVDARVQDASSLVQGVTLGTEIAYLQQRQDGLQQMTDYLAHHPGATSVQIVAHGESGDLWLGSTYISADNVNDYAASLSQIGSEMKPGGDILIYACNTAQDARGVGFVESLAQLTGHNIAASNNRTGIDGDWNLEVATGDINAAPVLSSASETAYQHDLLTLTVTSNADSGAGTLRNTIASATAGDTITFNAGMTITLTTGQLTINKNLTIEGDLDANGTPDVTIDANYNSQVLQITTGTVSLDGLVIEHGVLAGIGGSKGSAGGSSYGAGIANAGTLTLRNSTVTANFATGGGGGPANNAAAGGKGGAAGATTGSNGNTYLGYAGSGSSGGKGGSYDGTAKNGRGGTSAGGGAGGTDGAFGYIIGGAGITATAGGTTFGGGGGGAGWADTGSSVFNYDWAIF